MPEKRETVKMLDGISAPKKCELNLGSNKNGEIRTVIAQNENCAILLKISLTKKA
ncbi:MAG: hypothetical protein J5850_02160 [Clostridia bacterium]|nr:hypothetical protein [Clostridia bacterium]